MVLGGQTKKTKKAKKPKNQKPGRRRQRGVGGRGGRRCNVASRRSRGGARGVLRGGPSHGTPRQIQSRDAQRNADPALGVHREAVRHPHALGRTVLRHRREQTLVSQHARGDVEVVGHDVAAQVEIERKINAKLKAVYYILWFLALRFRQFQRGFRRVYLHRPTMTARRGESAKYMVRPSGLHPSPLLTCTPPSQAWHHTELLHWLVRGVRAKPWYFLSRHAGASLSPSSSSPSSDSDTAKSGVPQEILAQRVLRYDC